MTTTLAIANQKGGVAKTTTVASIGAALAELGHKVLLVDLDPQACLTFSLGIDPEDLELSVHHVLTKGLDPLEVIIETDDGVDLLPATIELARAEADLLTRTGREHVIKSAIEALDEDEAPSYDWVLLDCPPSLGVLTVAALTAADGVLIPLQCETLSHRGVGQLLDTVHDVRRFTNRKLEVWGVLPTLYDGRTNHARTGARDDLGDLRPRGRRAADPEDDQVRRGAGRRPLDPVHQPQQQGRAGLPRGRRQPGRPLEASAKSPREDAAPRRTPRRPATMRRHRSAGRASVRPDRRAGVVVGRHRRRRARRHRGLPSAADAGREPPASRSRPGRPTPTPGVPRAAAATGIPGTARPRPSRAPSPGAVEPARRRRHRAPGRLRQGQAASSSARAGSGSGWSAGDEASQRTYLVSGSSTTTSTPAPTRSTRAPSRPTASTTRAR